MHSQSTTAAVPVLPDLLAGLPLTGKLRPATTVSAALTYERTSKSVQTSIPDQFERITKLSHMLDVPICHDLSDTGSGMRADRDGYQRLLDEAGSGQYSHLLLFRADRLARDSAELTTTIKMLWRLGMEVWDTSTGKITPDNLPFLAMWAEMEIRILSERTRMGLEGKAKMGKKLGSIPWGYRRGERAGYPVKDPGIAPTIGEMFERVARGETLESVRRWVRDVSGRRLGHESLLRVLRNPYYAGMVVNFRSCHSILEGRYARPQGEWTYATHDQPLVAPELFMEVQARLGQHANVGQHRAQHSKYALQGILWCVRCNRRMCGHDRDTRGSSYRCPACGVERGKLKVERAVQSCLSLLELCAEDALTVARERQLARTAELRAALAAVSEEVRRLTARRHLLYDRLDRGVIDEEQYQAQVRALDAEREQGRAEEARLRQALAELPAHESMAERVAVERTDWRNWARDLAVRSIEQQQAIYRECCARIELVVPANTLTVHYTPHIALVLGHESHTVPL